MEEEKVAKGCAVLVGAVLIWALLGLLMAFPVMWLWNWVMPNLFKVGTLTWTQAWALYTLCSFLFKGNTTVQD